MNADASGQAAPPFAAATRTVRVEVCTPVPPQATEHTPKAVQLLMTQSLGLHGNSGHAIVCTN